MASSTRYEYINYEVWGNERDGFEVNDAHRTGVMLRIDDGATDAQLIAALRKAGVFNRAANTRTVAVEGAVGYTFYFNQRSNAKPLGELRAVGG